MKRVMMLVAVLICVTVANAQEKRALTIEEAISVGLENSRALHQADLRIQYADAKSGEVNASRLPSLKFAGSYTRLSDLPPFQVTVPLPPPAPNTFTLSPSILNNYATRFSVQQPLFTGFRLDGTSEAADYTVEAANQDYKRNRQDLVYNIKNAYWGLYRAIEIKKVTDENVAQIKAHLTDVQSLMDQGMATDNDVLKVQVQLSDAQLKQIDARNSVRLSTIGLDNTLGIPLNTEIGLSSRIDHRPREFAGLDSLIQDAMEARPDLKAMDARIRADEAGVKVARSGWFPQIYLTGNYYYARPNQRLLPTQDIFKDTWDIGVNVSLDIWNWGTSIHQVDQAQSLVAQAKEALGQMQDGITFEITQSYLNMRQAKERITVARQGVAQAEENYRIDSERFKEGLALNSDMLDAEVALLQAKTNYTQALVDYELAEAQLERSIGE